MEFELETKARNIPDDELIADVKRVSVEISKSPTLDEYNERGKFHSTTITRRFGSWFKVLEMCGLEKTRSDLNISEEELFLNLEELWVKLGKQPRYQEVCKPLSKYSAGTYEKRYGTWQKALEKFVSYINNERSTSEDVGVPKSKVIEGEADSRHKTKRSINWRLRFLVMKRDNFKCKNCGRAPATDQSVVLHVDHIRPWAKGGETVLENLQTLCSVCNIGKSDLE
jgi:5-methylcytosine-specific restriction endonuclease McrA